MGSIGRGFRLVKASWGVVRSDKELLLLPVFSFLSILVVSVIFGLGAFGVGIPKQGESPSPALYVLAFCAYVALWFVAIFFNAAVIGTAMKRLKGEDAKISHGLALARQHIRVIFIWAIVTATVGVILRAVQERAGIFGRFIGVAWNVITFFVVPVLLFEEAGAIDAIKRSASLFKQRWGEQSIGNATIGIAMLLIAIPVLTVGTLLVEAVPVVGVIFLVVAIGLFAAIGAALSGVFNAALYRFATTGESSGAFTQEDLNALFRPRKGKGLLGDGTA